MKRLLVLLLAAVASGCWDYAHIDAVANLGPEKPGVPPGPTHRPGQPCTTCHGPDGPSDLEISVGGTLYSRRYVEGQAIAPLVNATVWITDADGTSKSFATNEVGNFWVPKSEWDPAWPLRVAITSEDVRREMTTTIGREGSCGACHRSEGGPSLMPAVFLRDK